MAMWRLYLCTFRAQGYKVGECRSKKPKIRQKLPTLIWWPVIWRYR